MAEFRKAIWDICYKNEPLSARQGYYRAVVEKLVDKDIGDSRKNESKVGDALDYMRERGIDSGIYGKYWPHWLYNSYQEIKAAHSGGNVNAWRNLTYRQNLIMPFRWITDNTRTRYQASQYGDADDALNDMARLYRRDLWRSQERHVEVWCESDSIGGVLMQTTNKYGVAMLPCRGQSGKGFIFESAQAYRQLDKPITCLYAGDFDPAGLDIGNSLETRLERYGAPDFEFRRLCIEPEQVRDMGLPGHGLNPNHPEPVKQRFTRVCDEYGIPHEAVEAEAMEPDILRQIVEDTILEYIDPHQWALEEAVEAEERQGLWGLAERGLSGEATQSTE